jgi:hypothetical protein
MSVLLDKSENSVSAAEFLHQDSFYAPSVHCSYYSCIQLMKHLVINYFEDFENDNDFEYQQRESGKGSHEFLINYIYRKLNEIGGNCRNFNSIIVQLKRKRIQADYKEILVNESESKWAIEKSLEVNNELKTSFVL